MKANENDPNQMVSDSVSAQEVTLIEMAGREIVRNEGTAINQSYHQRNMPGVNDRWFYTDNGFAWLTELGWNVILTSRRLMERLTTNIIPKQLRANDLHPIAVKVVAELNVHLITAMSDEDITQAIVRRVKAARAYNTRVERYNTPPYKD